MNNNQPLQNRKDAVSIFSQVPLAPPDAIFGIDIAFGKDDDPNKVNLGNGVYRDHEGLPFVFPIIRKVEEEIVAEKLNKDYLPIDGIPTFTRACQTLTFGQNCQALKENKIVTVQTISGTGSLRVGFEFLAKYNPREVYISNPTWANHRNILQKARLEAKDYPYYNEKTRSFDITGMVTFLQTVPEGSIIVLHACAHNPTGFDPSQQEWKKIAKVMKNKNLLPYFDSAYQGFASGDLQKDAWAIRYFTSLGFQLFVSVSFSKNMGLYAERAGVLHIVTANSDSNQKILSQLKDLIRANYSNPPAHGARLVDKILNDPENKQTWIKQLNDVAGRIIEMRKVLREQLEAIHTPGTWNHITQQIGMFSYLGLTVQQCQLLTNKYHIYLMKTGRISVSGINLKNVKYLAQSIKSVVQETT